MKNIKPYTNYLEESFSDPFNDYPKEDLTIGGKFSPLNPDTKQLGRLEDRFLKMLEEAKKPSPEDLLKILKEFVKMNVDIETLALVFNLLRKENPEFDFQKGLLSGGFPSEASKEAVKIIGDRVKKAGF